MRTYNIARTAVIGLLASTLVATPAFAFAANTLDATASEEAYVTDVTDSYNKEYVAELRGLTDAERAELIALLDARDAAWEAGVEFDATSSMRIAQLEHIDLVACAADTLSAAETQELKDLLAAFDALPLGTYMSHADWDRMQALEYKSYDPEWEAVTNDQLAAELKGVSDAERAEFAEISYRIDQDVERGLEIDESLYARLDAIYEIEWQESMKETLGAELYAEYQVLEAKLEALPAGSYLTHAEFDRLEELENRAYEIDEPYTTAGFVSDLVGLTDQEREELTNLLYESEQDYRRDFDVAESVNDRIDSLYHKAEMAEAKARLTADEYAEYEKLDAKAMADQELTDAEWDRYFALMDKVYPVEG